MALLHGGADELKNLQILCIGCHGEKSEMERLGGIYRKSLYFELSREVLELFKSAPKPRQLVWGDGTNDCVQIDVVACRRSALEYNTHPLPIASVVDRILTAEEWAVTAATSPAPDFVYIDAGEPLDDVEHALPYMGPGWYWRENAGLIKQFGRCKAGNVQYSDCKYFFTASDHVKCDALVEPLKGIESIIEAALVDHERWESEPTEYTSGLVEKKIKQAILSMIGSWTTQHTVSWRCDTAKYEEDVRGRVVKWRANEDGTRNMLTDSETLSNRTMFLIGRIPLDVEQATLFNMRRSMRFIEPPLQITP